MAKKKDKKSKSSKNSKKKTSKKEDSSKGGSKVVERTYSFPSLGKTVKAKSREEAQDKVK